eukprot:3173145-Amphidinium_carterae.2
MLATPSTFQQVTACQGPPSKAHVVTSISHRVLITSDKRPNKSNMTHARAKARQQVTSLQSKANMQAQVTCQGLIEQAHGKHPNNPRHDTHALANTPGTHLCPHQV